MSTFKADEVAALKESGNEVGIKGARGREWRGSLVGCCLQSTGYDGSPSAAHVVPRPWCRAPVAQPLAHDLIAAEARPSRLCRSLPPTS